jgi:hypothetical protein
VVREPAVVAGLGDRCQLRADTEFLQHAAHVASHGRLGHHPQLRNLVRRVTVTECPQRALLAIGEAPVDEFTAPLWLSVKYAPVRSAAAD